MKYYILNLTLIPFKMSLIFAKTVESKLVFLWSKSVLYSTIKLHTRLLIVLNSEMIYFAIQKKKNKKRKIKQEKKATKENGIVFGHDRV
jgi:hypothetical protein